MNLDPAQNHFAEHQQRSMFFPWTFLVLGSLLAYEVPNIETHRALMRHARAYHLATLFLLALSIPVGIWFNLVWVSVAATLILPTFVYSCCIRRRVTELVRIPLQRSVAAFAGKLGAERLWRNVFLGVIAVLLGFLFSSGNVGLVAITTPLAVNSCVAFYALRFVSL